MPSSDSKPIQSKPIVSQGLHSATSTAWVDTVIEQFDNFLIDHAACERKASAVATSMICHYPDKKELVRTMADLAAEEMIHYREVIKLIHQRGITLTADQKDPYVNALRKEVRHGRLEYFLDRLLIAGVVEARGAERFGLIAEHHPDRHIRKFYAQLAESERRHETVFVDLALNYCDASIVATRHQELLAIEGNLINSLPHRAALH